jgi:hypothetical protein
VALCFLKGTFWQKVRGVKIHQSICLAVGCYGFTGNVAAIFFGISENMFKGTVQRDLRGVKSGINQ